MGPPNQVCARRRSPYSTAGTADFKGITFIYIPANVSTWKHGGIPSTPPCWNWLWTKECVEEGTPTTTQQQRRLGRLWKNTTRFGGGSTFACCARPTCVRSFASSGSRDLEAPSENLRRHPWLILLLLLPFVSSSDVLEQQQQPAPCNKVSVVHVAFEDIDVGEGSS